MLLPLNRLSGAIEDDLGVTGNLRHAFCLLAICIEPQGTPYHHDGVMAFCDHPA